MKADFSIWGEEGAGQLVLIRQLQIYSVCSEYVGCVWCVGGVCGVCAVCIMCGVYVCGMSVCVYSV